MKQSKRFVAALLILALLCSFSVSAAPAGTRSQDVQKTFAKANDNTVTVTPSQGEEWTLVPAGQTYESQGEDGFSYVADRDVWISAETLDEEQISFADIFNFEPDQVQTVEENGVTYTIRTYSSNENVEKLNQAFSAIDGDVAQMSNENNTIIVENYADDEMVEVMVVLEGAPVAETAGITLGGLEANALTAVKDLQAQQSTVLKAIEKKADSFQMTYSYSLLINGFAGTVEYGQLEDLQQVKGVKYAFLAPQFAAIEEDVIVLGEEDAAVVAQGIESGAIVPAMENARDDMNTEEAWLAGYDGEGMVVAIIDTGIDLDHAMLSVDPTNPALTKDDIAALIESQDLNAEGLEDFSADTAYVSAKIPFSFDYGMNDTNADDEMGHGSHVAGIIGAVTTENLKKTYGIYDVGVAPNAQLLAMKVFNASGGASMTSVCAALEDAIMLGVDAANLSLGVSCGSVTAYPEITAVFNNALAAGLNVFVAAGNDATTTQGSLWGNGLGITENVDIGTLNMPTTFDAPISVASADNSTYLAGFSSSIDRLQFSVGANNYNYSFTDKSPFEWRFGNVLGGKAYEYEYVNFGAEADYADVDVTGKLVLAKLSEDLSINEQSRIAAEQGAVGMILYPESSAAGGGSFKVPDTTHDEYTLPVVGMAYYYGNNLATTIIPDVVNVPAYWVEREDGTQISSFSSWGPTNELTLKPEITGIGGSVVSCYNKNSIAISSGTSMASPAVCGISVLVRQYIKENQLETQEYMHLNVNDLLMSTADLIIDAQSGLPFSPRAQGAGLVNAGAAIASNVFVYNSETNRAKVELGDDPERTGIYNFNLQLATLVDEDRSYEVEVITMTESAVGGRVNPDLTYEYLMEQFAYELNPVVTAPETIRVSEGSLDVTIELSDADRAYIEKYFPYGVYVEGYVVLKSLDEGGVDLSVPFMGFYGDWTKVPTIESNFYWDWPSDEFPANTTLFANTVYTYDENAGETWYLGDTRGGNGQTHYGIQRGSKMMYWDERNAISPNGDGVRDYLEVATGLLRSVKSYRYIITDRETGEILYEKEMGYIPKAYYSSSYETVLTAGMYVGNELDFDWSTLDNYQTVIVRIEAIADIEGNDNVESWEFPVTVDNDAPVTAIRLYKSGSKYYTQNQINETRFLDYTHIYANLKNGDVTRYKATYGGYDPAGRVVNVTMGVSDNATELVSISLDYAGNSNYLYITMSEKENMVDLDAENVIMMPGDTMEIKQLYVYDTNTTINCPLTWTTSDASVVSFLEMNDQHAIIQANAVGTATITAKNGFNIEDSVTVEVVPADDEGYAVVIFDAGEYGTFPQRAKTVVPVGYVLTDADVPTVTADFAHLFKSWDKEPVGYVVNEDVTFTAKYRRNLSTGETYLETDTIVPGETYLIASQTDSGTFVMSNKYHVNNEAVLKGVQVVPTTVNGVSAIVSDDMTGNEWTFTTATGGQIQNKANGKYLSTHYNSGNAFLGLASSSSLTWTWDGQGHMVHDDASAGSYTHLGYGLSITGYSAAFDLFDVTDVQYYNPVKLYKHTIIENNTKYTVTYVDGLTGQVISTQEVAECLDATLPTAPTHEGYTFVRWDDDGKFITDDLTITAEYTINNYNVTFVDGLTGETLSAQTVTYGEDAVAPAVPEHVGYTFTGWSADYTKVASDLTVTANYQLNSYTVRFLDWDDTVLDTQTVNHGAAATAPSDPSREHYTFLTWDTDFACITGDTDVKAVYVENDITNYYAIAIICSEGGLVEGPELVCAGDDATYTITTLEGYVMDGVWVDGEEMGLIDSYTFENVNEAHYIEARFHAHNPLLTNYVEATCEDDGYTGDVICTICGEVLDEGEVIDALGHDYEAVVTAPTCTENGYTTYTCTICGDSYIADEVPALGHTAVLVGAMDKTCTADGYTGDLVCEVCGEVLEQGEVIPAFCGTAVYEDLDVDQWYHEYTDFVIENGLMQGISETLFAPNATLTRAQLVTVLYRVAGEPAVDGLANPFADVAEGQWYTDAVVWAADSGIVNGISETLFAPNAAVTREQAATILYRACGVQTEGDLAGYTDGEAVSEYAVEAMIWATEIGLFNGFEDETLRPQDTLTRVQMAKLLTVLAQL